MGKIRRMSDEQALNSMIPSGWEAIRTNWGATADAGPPEVIDFAESNDANIAQSIDVTDCTFLLIWSNGEWAFIFTEEATPIGYDITWINAGGEYAMNLTDDQDGKRVMRHAGSMGQLVVPVGAKIFNYRTAHKSSIDRFMIVVKT